MQVPRKAFEHLACGLVFKHLPRDLTNVNARKTMVVSFIMLSALYSFQSTYEGFTIKGKDLLLVR